MKSLDVFFTAPEKAEIIEQELPEINENQVLCKTEYSHISIGTELHCYKGVFDPDTHWAGWVKHPFRPGYSNIARVVKVGSAVTELKVGDRVRSAWHHRQYYVSKTDGLYLVPDDVDPLDAVWINLAGVSQKNVRKCDIKLGDTVVVIGQGPVGQLATQFVKNSGALDIIAIDPVASRAEGARLSGATHVLSCTAGEAVEKVTEITDGRLADVVIDTTGHPKALGQACLLVRPIGKLGLVGDTVTPSLQALGPGVISKSITIIGTGGTAHIPGDTPLNPWAIPLISGKLTEWTDNLTTKLLQKNKVSFKHLVSHKVSPADAPEVYANLLRDRAAYQGVVFDWSMLD